MRHTLTLAEADVAHLSSLSSSLPQSLILEAELGLDYPEAVNLLAAFQPSHTYWLRPEDGKSSISVEQIRLQLSKLATFSSERRIIAIDLADQMTPQAQNALLKNLEEPSQSTYFILISHNLDHLLDTVKSRCQVYSLSRTSRAQDESILTASSLDDAARKQILFLASGRPGLIRKLADNPRIFKEYQEIAADAKQIISTTNAYDRLQTAMKHSKSREDALRLLDILLAMIRFQLKQTGEKSSLLKMAEDISDIETALKRNAHTKTTLLQLI